jgi:hypothetical protein
MISDLRQRAQLVVSRDPQGEMTLRAADVLELFALMDDTADELKEAWGEARRAQEEAEDARAELNDNLDAIRDIVERMEAGGR